MGFLENLGKAAATAASNAANRAEEMIEVNRLKSQQNSLKSDVAATKRRIGEYCFKLYEDGKIEDEKILEFCKEIEDLREEIADIEKQMNEAKADYAEQRADKREQRL